MAPSYPEYEAQSKTQYPYPPSNVSSNTFIKPNNERGFSRTPSPTPSEEAELLRDGMFDWKAMTNWRFWIRRQWLWYYVIGGVILVITILITVFDKQIVKWLTPATHWMHDLSFGWLIPIAILFVISFPPLFGHEIIAILCGVVWGLWAGFGIVAAGTFLGELGNFYAFKYCCRARGDKLEKENISYACLAKVVRDGGFLVAVICRLSVMPGHFTTAIFSTCGMTVIVFSVACILSMPKQLITVYIGVILEETGTGTQTTRDRIISDAVLGVTIAVTIAAMWYLLHKMRQVKPDIIYARRKARQGKLERADFTPYGAPNNSSTSVVFNAQMSDTNIPLNPAGNLPYGASAPYQQWDKDGRAVGYAGDPRLYAPEPRRPQNLVAANSGGDIGTAYPQTREHPGGRTPLRQESGDSVAWNAQDRRDTFDIPRIVSPVHEPMHNPFESADVRQASSSSHVTQTPTQAQFSQPPGIATDITSSILPNPFTGATPTQFNHPQVPFHAADTTDASFYAADGHLQAGTEETLQNATGRAFPPPPPNYMTNTPRQ